MKIIFEVSKGDITEAQVDVIVNAANTSLLGGGGVDGAIHRKGGVEILNQCRAILARQGGCKVGEAVMTSAGELRAERVIHTVGPKWNGGKSNEPSLLYQCYTKSLDIADFAGFESIAFPNISTGRYGYPKRKALEVVAQVADDFQPINLKRVIFICFDSDNYELYRKHFAPND